jgi:hypothetical protein
MRVTPDFDCAGAGDAGVVVADGAAADGAASDGALDAPAFGAGVAVEVGELNAGTVAGTVDTGEEAAPGAAFGAVVVGCEG